MIIETTNYYALPGQAAAVLPSVAGRRTSACAWG